MPQKLSLEDFLLSMKLAPRLAVELLIEDSKGQLLLEKRDDEPYKGMWHIPGGFLLKDEKISQAIERIANDELDLKVSAADFDFLGIFESIGEDPRGHIVHYVARLKNLEAKGDFFDKVPANTIPYQIRLLEKVGYSTSNQSIGESSSGSPL